MMAGKLLVLFLFACCCNAATESQRFQTAVTNLLDFGRKFVATYGNPSYVPSPRSQQYPFFGFIPDFMGGVIPGGDPLSFATSCFKKVTVTASAIDKNGISTVTLDAQQPTGLVCSEVYLFGTLSELALHEVLTAGSGSVQWNTSTFDSAQLWDINKKGVRVLRFIESLQGLAYDINQTIALFASYGTPGVSEVAGALNVQFLQDYAYRKYLPRSIQEVTLDESLVNDGDFLGVIRLDGLDPMLAWAMGSVTGHTTVALRDPNGVLQVCESTISSAYWPTDNIQCTPYQTWLQQAKAAGYLVTHAALSPASQKTFNSTAAWNYFKTVEGFSYGFYNQFWGWIDTEINNYPCLPPDFQTCLTWQVVELITGWVEKVSWDLANQFFIQSLNHRIGTFNLSVAEIYQTGYQDGYSTTDLYTMVELDSYQYNTTRNGQPAVGPSMVCCVFVCEVWKHGGLYDNIDQEVNCAEATNWDDYCLAVFDGNYQKPPQCEQADPNNPNCQLEGAYTLVFDDYNTKTPYAHMAEACPSQNPYYQRPSNC